MNDQPENYTGSLLRSVGLLLVAAVFIFGVGAIFVRIVSSYQKSQGIESGSAALAESKANEEDDPIIEAPPSDIPLYKGGSLESAREANGGWTYVYMFPLGSIEQIRDFYHAEMAKLGWQKYAGGTGVSLFLKDEGQRKASLSFKYYGGKVRLRLLTSN